MLTNGDYPAAFTSSDSVWFRPAGCRDTPDTLSMDVWISPAGAGEIHDGETRTGHLGGGCEYTRRGACPHVRRAPAAGTDGDAVIRLLGPVELSARGRALRLKSRLQRGLIAAFALHVNRTVPGRVLIDALWAEDPPATSEAQVRRQVARLRRDLGEEMEIVTDPGGYRLRADPGRVDAVAFERRVADARRAAEAGELDKAGGELAAALNLWRGPALSDLRGAYFEAEAALLEERHLMAQDEYAETRMAGGEHRDLIGELTARVSRYPMHERPRAQLMLALHRAGRQAEALETYRRGRDLLVARTRPGAVAGAGPAAPGDSDVGGRPSTSRPPRGSFPARALPVPTPATP